MNDLIHDDVMDPELMEDEAEGFVKRKKLYIMEKILFLRHMQPQGV
jgi:hypothetical protein